MTKSNESRNMWRINRHGAGTKRRIRKVDKVRCEQ